MLTWLGGNSHESVTSAAVSVCTSKPQQVWTDRPSTSSFDLDLCLFTTNNCVSKPVYLFKAWTVVGVSGQLESTYFRCRQCGCCAELKSHLHIASAKSLWASLRNSKDPKQATANSSFQFHSSVLSPQTLATYSIAAAGKEFLSKNSGCMIKDFSDPYGCLKLEQTEGKAGIKLWIWLMQHS